MAWRHRPCRRGTGSFGDRTKPWSRSNGGDLRGGSLHRRSNHCRKTQRVTVKSFEFNMWMLPHTHEVSTAPRVARRTLLKCHKTGSQINSTEPMHKQTNRFLLRKELRKLAKWLQPLRRGKACSRPAWALRVCLCASESVYGLALSGSHYGTFEYTCADSNGSGSTQGSKRRWSGPRRKMSDRGKEG